MANYYQIGPPDQEMHFNPLGQFPGYPYSYGQFHQVDVPGNGLQSMETNPGSVQQLSLGFDTVAAGINNAIPSQMSYGFQSANWYEEHPLQASYERPFDLMTTEQFSSEQSVGGPNIGFENYGRSDLNDYSAHYHSINFKQSDNGNRDHTFSCNVETFANKHDFAAEKRRYSTLPAESGSGNLAFSTEETGKGMCSEKKTRSKSMYSHSVQAFPNNALMGPQIGTLCPQQSVNPGISAKDNEWRINLLELPHGNIKNFTSFCEAVKIIRGGYSALDPASNSGRIWSVAVAFPNHEIDGSELNITVFGDCLLHPLNCIQNDSVPVQDVITHIFHQIYQDPPPQGCLLSICGLDEYLQNAYTMKSHKNLQRTNFVQLRLSTDVGIQPHLARTCEDDKSELNLDDLLEHAQYWQEIKKRLVSAVAQYGEQVQYLLGNEQNVSNVIEAVKELCYLLRSVETKEISEAIRALNTASLIAAQNWKPNSANTAKVHIQSAVIQLSRAISHLINIHSTSFHTDFHVEIPSSLHRCCVDSMDPHLSFHLYAAHNLLDSWVKSNSVFSVSCSVIYAGRMICPVITSGSTSARKSLFSMAIWDEKINIPVTLESLPHESVLIFKLSGVNESSTDASILAWSCLPLYSRQRLVHGSMLLNMISHVQPPPIITPGAFDISLPTLVTVQVDFLERNQTFIEPQPDQESYYNEAPAEDSRNHLEMLAHRNSVLLLSEADKHSLWYYRSCCNKTKHILPLVLGSAPACDPASISAMYRVLRDWTFSDPLEALGLLNSCFSDQNICETACQQIGNLSNDEMLDYLPQLVQAVKYQWDLDNALVRLLLDRSLQSIQVAHRLYWLLTDAMNEFHYKSVYQKLLLALQFCVGKAMNDEFLKERTLIKILQDIAEKVKTAQDSKRQETLQSNLSKLEHFFQEVQVCRLPQDPAIVVKGIARSVCSYFKSNASPLKVSFVNADLLGKNINVIFKLGDDLRQDMLVLQIIGAMDRIWLQEGLDMCMIIYKCLSTGAKQGLVQMVSDATTLAKIHKRSGLIGPLKEGTIKKWFTHHDSLQSSYQKVSDNFFYSCAGWCVVTFILGVCDRHNDNIMVTDTGHMFHIDFGKFLGHSQKFGSIKRDRVPFIFTTEMEYFITEGGKNPQRFRDFVELCCRAYNIIRKQSHLLMNLLELMLQAGLPELCDVQDLKYMHNNLRPQDSDLEATSYFTRKIKESLECLPVKLNNMIHILATMSLSDTVKSASQIDLSESSLTDTKKLMKKVAVSGFRKIHEKGGKMLDMIRDEVNRGRSEKPSSVAADKKPGVQLHISFKKPNLLILLKHLKNIHLPDGSPPTAHVEISLLPDPSEVTLRKIKAQSKSADPTYNEIVEYFVTQLEGLVLRLIVKSKGTFIAAVNIWLNTVQLNEDVWYPLGNSVV